MFFTITIKIHSEKSERKPALVRTNRMGHIGTVYRSPRTKHKFCPRRRPRTRPARSQPQRRGCCTWAAPCCPWSRTRSWSRPRKTDSPLFSQHKGQKARISRWCRVNYRSRRSASRCSSRCRPTPPPARSRPRTRGSCTWAPPCCHESRTRTPPPPRSTAWPLIQRIVSAGIFWDWGGGVRSKIKKENLDCLKIKS